MADQQAVRERLTGMLAELDDSARTLTRNDADYEPDELSHLDQHPADSASYVSENDREDAMYEVVDGQRQEIEAALHRLDEGTYGRCVDCGKELPAERLEARPEAARCVECQAKAEGTAR